MILIHFMPINTPNSAILLLVLGSAYDTKKAQVFASSAYPGILGLRIASPHRIDNAY